MGKYKPLKDEKTYIQWGVEYQISSVFRWTKCSRFFNGLDFKNFNGQMIGLTIWIPDQFIRLVAACHLLGTITSVNVP